MAPKLASSIVYPDTFEKRIGLDLSSGHPSQKRIGLDLSRLGRAGKRLFLSQPLSRTEAKTEVTVIIAPLPRPAGRGSGAGARACGRDIWRPADH